MQIAAFLTQVDGEWRFRPCSYARQSIRHVIHVDLNFEVVPMIMIQLVARARKISTKLLGTLAGFPKEHPHIFSHYNSLKSLRRCFDRYRKRTAHKYGNPRILNITLHTLRHWKATTEYHKTKDILHVMQLLGHKNIQNTLVYTQLVKTQNDDEFICKVARTPSEIQELIENGFEYICDLDSQRFFRKRR